MKKETSRVLRKRPKISPLLKWLFLSVVVFVALLPILSLGLFLDMPARSADFDCDDAVLFMYNRLSKLNIKATPLVGDLTVTGEKYNDITHIWLLVNIAGIRIPFDWGSYWFDKQHYEGYSVTYDDLLMFVNQDKSGKGSGVSLAARN